MFIILLNIKFLCKNVWHSDQMKGTDADIDFDWSIMPGMEEQV